jgi:hypothetical protein
VHGVDLDRLDRWEQLDTVLTGWTTLTGTWRERELHVRSQTAWQPPARQDPWTVPPCPPPPEGWLSGPQPPAPRRADWPALTITQVTNFHPEPDRNVLVVAAEDPERAEQALRPTLDAALCVVRSRHTQAQIDAAWQRIHAEALAGRWLIGTHGHSATEDGQHQLTAQFAWLLPEVAEWATTVPEGLLAADVWLTPA